MQMLSKILLFPYYIALKVRNGWWDRHASAATGYDIPVISIGNVTVGGTGKTPHIEMFIREYLDRAMRVAVVSRGYGRRNGKASHLVKVTDTAEKVGDEPLQIKRKFPQVSVIVDRNRIRAIDTLMKLPFGDVPEVILLDDALQYRKIAPSRQICLITYNRPVFKDNLLPLGRLRDLPEQIRRADTIIITKCPPYLNEWEKEQVRSANHINPRQKVYFTDIRYMEPEPVFEGANNRYIYSKEAILLTGIANSRPIRDWVNAQYPTNHHIEYADHHYFTKKDIRTISRTARRHPRCILITTEKDAQRLRSNPWVGDDIRERLFCLPITTALLDD
ncbi:MAG: tetraacyldisaccharide 4'-kinase, partial [Bacteroidales bacterium]|nr:tetraacyldisaccharide 4'-kinase [Bacteroidales bacterium]